MKNGAEDRSSGRNREIGNPQGAARRVRYGVVASLLVLANFTAEASMPSSCPGLHIRILDIRNNEGTIGCALFETKTGFPIDYLRMATNIIVRKIRDNQARCDFVDIPPGLYALAVIHDENMNGKLDVNWLGIPTEGYGFSNNAKALIGAPSFSAASFPYRGQKMALSIRLHY